MADKIVQLQDSAGDNIFPVTDPSTILDMFYPVGSYYETSNTSFDPNVSWGGTWVEDTAGKFLVAQDSNTFATVGDTGGYGSSLPPYVVIKRWHRTA